MDQQVGGPHYITLSQQLRDRATVARQQRDKAAWLAYSEAKEKAGPHPIYEPEELARALEFVETELWKAASKGEDSITIPFVDIPVLRERKAYMETNFPILAKAELREAIHHVISKFRDTHPEFDNIGGEDNPSVMALISTVKISW